MHFPFSHNNLITFYQSNKKRVVSQATQGVKKTNDLTNHSVLQIKRSYFYAPKMKLPHDFFCNSSIYSRGIGKQLFIVSLS